MPGRHGSAGDGYRHGFNGKEEDAELKGKGNQLNYGARIYDARIAKFLSVDPLTSSFPWYTPYQFAGNKPIISKDLDGEEEYIVIHYRKNEELHGIVVIHIPTDVFVYQTTSATRDKYIAKKIEALKEIDDMNAAIRSRRGDKKQLKGWISDAEDFIVEADRIISEQERLIAEGNAMITENATKVAYVERDLSEFTCFNNKSTQKFTETVNNNYQQIIREMAAEGVLEEAFRINEQLWFDAETTKNSTFQRGVDQNKVSALAHYFPTELKVSFKSNNASLSTEDKTNIKNNLYNSLNAYPGMKVELIGHTDNQNTTYDGGNPGLSLDRAKAVKEYLTELGVDGSRITISGAGSSQPIGDNSTEIGRQQNRRIEVKTTD